MEKIIFNDGTVINAKRNGSCFITDKKPVFPDDLTGIRVEGEASATFENGMIVECASVDDKYWFTIVEVSADELERQRVDETIMELSELVAALLG